MKTSWQYSTLLLVTLIALVSVDLKAQGSIDAIRYARTDNAIGVRALGMGNAYTGVADDYSAVLWNPAGLAQMRRLEFTGALAIRNYSNSVKFFGTTSDVSTSGTELDNFGFVFPYPTIQGSLVFAVGYNRPSDFATALSFNGYNPTSSIIPWLYYPDASTDMARLLHLSDQSTGLHTTVRDNVQQSGELRESGGLGMLTFSGAIDVDKDLSFGLTINIISGKYSYVRNYKEADVRNMHQSPTNPSYNFLDSAFNILTYDNTVTTDLKAVNLIFGMMYRWEDKARFGVTVHAPTSYTIRDDYRDAGQTTSDFGAFRSDAYDAYFDYGVRSPWIFAGGASLYLLEELLLSADLEYADWTQIEWANNLDLERENITLQKKFHSTTTLRVGAEFEIPGTMLRVRGGLMHSPSAFVNDPSTFAVNTLTGGLGLQLQTNVQIDVAAALGAANTFHNNYNSDPAGLSRTDEKIKTTTVKCGVSYRF
ncbi:MAG: outer membrane protein transport protein [Ignavibacteriales bacterium]|nr:outer membrane protein transport protein [Ignavibacteriales bacterium]